MERRDFLQFMLLCYAQPRLTDELAEGILGRATSLVAKPSAEKGSVFLFLESESGSQRILRHLDWNTYQFTDHPIPLSLPHSLVQDKKNRGVVFVFETFGSFAKINLATGETLKIDHREGKEMSYGHATVTEAGDLLCTDVDPATSRGHVVVRSPKTLKVVAQLPPECDGSHQVAMMPGGRVAVCGVATDFGRGEKGAVTFVDTETRQVTRRV